MYTEREVWIRRAYEAGSSVVTLCRRFRASKSTVYRAIKGCSREKYKTNRGIEAPSEARKRRNERHALIIKLRDEGMLLKQIVHETKFCINTVRSVLSKNGRAKRGKHAGKAHAANRSCVHSDAVHAGTNGTA